LEGLDGVLKDWLDGLHDSESSLHIIDLWLHSLDGLHLSGDLNEWLSIIKSLQDSGGKSLLDVLDGSGLGNGGILNTMGLGGESGGEGGLERDKELILVHGVVGLLSLDQGGLSDVVSGVGGGRSGEKGNGSEFHSF
jgi:hypothetical protein